ncbi:MAG: EamA/RhaT family transporter, partial [Proteobacteria bacterium]
MSLVLGLLAAISWGIHDLCVRQVSQKTGIFASIVAVLAFGCILVTPISIFHWDGPMAKGSLSLALLSGALFGLAAIAHYKAFSIGPVRLVAPIIGSYPILSVGWAMLTGTPISVLQWMAVGLVIAGVGYVAISDDKEADWQDPKPAILWSIAAGTGFAITFAVGQAAVAHGGEIALMAPTRVAALIGVLAIATILNINWRAQNGLSILALMGVLDTIAL